MAGALNFSPAINKLGLQGKIFYGGCLFLTTLLRGQLRLEKEDWARGVEDLEEAHRLQPSPQVMLIL